VAYVGEGDIIDGFGWDTWRKETSLEVDGRIILKWTKS
jgi:hypothetical protein